MDLVTIAVAVYNGAKYLDRCLTSVKEQDYENIEVLIVDDGSTDDSVDIIKEYCNADPRFKLVIHPQNMGLPVTRNTAIKEAKGKYLAMIDVDDYLEKDYVSAMLNSIKRNNVRLCLCHHVTHYSADPSKSKRLPEDYKDRVISTADFDFFNENFSWTTWSFMFEKELLKDVWFNPKHLTGQDSPFLAKVLKKADKLVVLNRNLYHYIIFNDSNCHGDFNKRKLCAYKAWKEAIKTVNDMPFVHLTVCARYAQQCTTMIRKYHFGMGVPYKIYKMMLREYRKYVRYLLLYAVKKPSIANIFNAASYLVFAVFPSLYPKYYLLKYHEKS